MKKPIKNFRPCCQQKLHQKTRKVGMPVNITVLYFLQLLGVVSVGGFVGQFFRASHDPNISTRVFCANLMSCVYLSLILASVFYLVTQNKYLSFAIGGIVGYQDEKYLSRIARSLLKQIMNEGGPDKNE